MFSILMGLDVYFIWVKNYRDFSVDPEQKCALPLETGCNIVFKKRLKIKLSLPTSAGKLNNMTSFPVLVLTNTLRSPTT